jgi:hypothetical protein
MSTVTELAADQVAAMLQRKRERQARRGSTAIEERQNTEVAATATSDGRVRVSGHSYSDRRGWVQLNVRVPPDLKDQVIARARLSGKDMGELVAEAVKAYLGRKDA